MKTEVMVMDRHKPEVEVLRKACEILSIGGVLAYPTETLYGLGADARHEKAVARVRSLKGRPEKEPVSVIAAGVDMAMEWVEFDSLAEKIIERFWPGPLTLILPLRDKSRGYLAGTSPGLGIRVPSLASARMLSAELGAPITATSANISGSENLLSVMDIERLFGDRIDLILDGGVCEESPGSTLLDLVTRPPKIVREGVIPSSDLSILINSTGS